MLALFKSSTAATWALVSAAGVLALFFVLRDDPLLAGLNGTAIVLLIVAAASGDSWRQVFDSGPGHWLRRGAALTKIYFSGLRLTVVDLASRLNQRRGTGSSEDLPGGDSVVEADPDAVQEVSDNSAGDRPKSVLAGLGLAVPVLLVFGALLAQADPVFASIFTSLFDPQVVNQVIGHFFAAAVTATVIVALALFRETPAVTKSVDAPVNMASATAVVLIGMINLLFGLFTSVQLWTLAGGARHVIDSRGLTFAQYARQGFFQLLWVAGLMFALMVFVRFAVGTSEYRSTWFRVQFVLAAALTLGIVAVAIGRLLLYIDAFGLTTLRFYTTVFSVWIAVAFLFLVASDYLFADRHWLTGSVALAALLFLFGVNLANPSALIVRDQLSGTDAANLYDLPDNGDAAVAAAKWLSSAPPDAPNRTHAEEELCNPSGPYRSVQSNTASPSSGLDFNLSRHRARQTREEVCSGVS